MKKIILAIAILVSGLVSASAQDKATHDGWSRFG